MVTFDIHYIYSVGHLKFCIFCPILINIFFHCKTRKYVLKDKMLRNCVSFLI